VLIPKWVLDFYALADNPTILALISQEADTTHAAVVSLIAARPERSPTVQIPVVQLPAQAAAVQVRAAVLPPVDRLL
jgi:hypothetical protein